MAQQMHHFCLYLDFLCEYQETAFLIMAKRYLDSISNRREAYDIYMMQKPFNPIWEVDKPIESMKY